MVAPVEPPDQTNELPPGFQALPKKQDADPWAEFGLQPVQQQATIPPAVVSRMSDTWSSFKSGVKSGVASVLHSTGEAAELEMGQIPSTPADKFEAQFGPFYKPQTTAGKYARAVGEMLPYGVLTPGLSLGAGIPGGLATAALSGIGGEAARQAAEGTPLEPFAPLIGQTLAPFAPTIAGLAWSGIKGLRLSDPNVKAAADKAATEALKPVDEALKDGGLKSSPQNAAASDLANAASVASAHSEITRSAGGAEQKVGFLPTEDDFGAAAKAVGGDAKTIEKLRALYEDRGIHPSEAAADALSNPESRASLLSHDKADLPREYDPWDYIPGTDFHGYEPNPEFPAALDKTIESARAQGIDAARLEPFFQNVPAGEKPKTANPLGTMGDGGIPDEAPAFGGFGVPEGGVDILNHPEGPAARKPIYSYTQQDRSGLRKAFDAMIDLRNKTFTPELVSDKALSADPLFAEYRSAVESRKDAILHAQEERHQFWRDVPDTERLKYIDAMERGDTENFGPEWAEHAEHDRAVLNTAMEMELEKGSKAAFRDEYFPHWWQDPDKARQFINNRIQQLGSRWFQKARTYDLIREGLDNGLRLKSTNPADIVTMRLLASADMVERMKLLDQLRGTGLAVPVEGTNIDIAREGWQPIIASDGKEWAVAPDAQLLWKNAVEAKGLWANEGMPGTVFRGWMALKNVWVPIKLSLSLFHPLHVLHINWNEGFARAYVQATKGGDISGALQSTIEGLTGPVKAAIPGADFLGKDVRQAWKILPEERTPTQQAMVKLMNDGGFVPELSEQLRINAARALEDAVDNGNYAKAGLMFLPRVLQSLQKPIFQEWIPSLKAAAYMNDASALIERRPDLLLNDAQRKVALRTIAKSIDNRFGEMFYGGLFWDRYVKDAGIGSFLSLGWQLGFAREFVSAPMQAIGRVSRRLMGAEPSVTETTIADAQNKLPYVISYISTAMLINGAMTYAFSGRMPEGFDWFFARTGRDNPDGSPHRLTNMFYTREIPMLLKHIQDAGGNVITGTMDFVGSKTLVEPIKEMWQNRDYYGSDIWDVNGPVYMQAWQAMKHILTDQFNPISVTGARRSYLESGDWKEAAGAILGFGPAPGYVDKSAVQNRISDLYRRHVLPASRPQVDGEKSRNLLDVRSELMLAKQKGDLGGMRDAARKWLDGGGSRQAMSNMIMGLPTDVSMFRALPEADQQAVIGQASKDEAAKYRPFLKTNIAAHVAELLYKSQIMAQAGNRVGSEVVKTQMQQLISGGIQNGDITDSGAFRRSVSQQLIARRAPELSAFMDLPKKIRPQYVPQLQMLQGLH